MNINSVSFGKTVKVYAPFHEARRIANAANGDPTVKPEIQRQVKKIFNDTDEGHALAFYFEGMSNVGYIFSGKESKEYLKALYQKAKNVRDIKFNPDKDYVEKIIKEKFELYKKVINLILKTEENFVLKIGENGNIVEKMPNLNWNSKNYIYGFSCECGEWKRWTLVK